MIIDFNEYDDILAEFYEAEDEFWKGVYEDLEAERIINENINNF